MHTSNGTKKTIIFDLDGTLINVSERLYELHSDLSRKYKSKKFNKTIYLKLKRKGISEEEIMRDKLKPVQLSQYLRKRKSLIESKHYLQYDQLKPGVRTLLQRLSATSNLYLTTARSNGPGLKAQLKKIDITKYFLAVIGSSSVDIRKNKLEQCIKLHKSRSYLIGDTQADYQLAKILKIKCLLVCDGTRNKKYLNRLNPDAVFDRITSLDEYFNL